MALSETVHGRLGYADASQIPLPLADKTGANAIVKEIARRRVQVVLPLFLCSLATYVTTLLALSYFPGLVGYKVFGSIWPMFWRWPSLPSRSLRPSSMRYGRGVPSIR
jgi:hypothetical protein